MQAQCRCFIILSPISVQKLEFCTPQTTKIGDLKFGCSRSFNFQTMLRKGLSFLNLVFPSRSRIIVDILTSDSLLPDSSWDPECKKRKLTFQPSFQRLVCIMAETAFWTAFSTLPFLTSDYKDCDIYLFLLFLSIYVCFSSAVDAVLRMIF